MQKVSQYYIEGIKEGREIHTKEGMAHAVERIANIKSTIKGFGADSPVGQMLRGERDFWLNQVKKILN